MDDKAPHCLVVTDGETRVVAAYERSAPDKWAYDHNLAGAYRLPAGYKIVKDTDGPGTATRR